MDKENHTHNKSQLSHTPTAQTGQEQGTPCHKHTQVCTHMHMGAHMCTHMYMCVCIHMRVQAAPHQSSGPAGQEHSQRPALAAGGPEPVSPLTFASSNTSSLAPALCTGARTLW